MVDRLRRVPLRDVWPHEALDFTRWMEENIDVLGEAINVEFADAEREQSAGAFSVDLIAKDSNGDLVIIENQLAKSDHDHLGKVITYLTVMGARRAVWIVSDPRPEHVQAVAWLNESSSADFFLLKVEAVKIGESEAAPLLTLITGPSQEAREAGEKKRVLSERDEMRRQFWSSLLDRAKKKCKVHVSISPTETNWISAGAGRAGLGYNYVILRDTARIALYIDRGKGYDTDNRRVFDALHAKQEEIEAAFGASLDWQALESKQACRIAHEIACGGLLAEEAWPGTQDAMIDAMVRFEKALASHIRTLPT